MHDWFELLIEFEIFVLILVCNRVNDLVIKSDFYQYTHLKKSEQEISYWVVQFVNLEFCDLQLKGKLFT